MLHVHRQQKRASLYMVLLTVITTKNYGSIDLWRTASLYAELSAEVRMVQVPYSMPMMMEIYFKFYQAIPVAHILLSTHLPKTFLPPALQDL